MSDNAGTTGGDVRARSKSATTNYHPARYHKKSRTAPKLSEVAVRIPRDRDTVEVRLGSKSVHLTNLRKVFWPDGGFTKGDLIQFYLDISHVLLPHIARRAMVMKRYPNGISGDFFFMKRAPSPRPEWIDICSIEHASGNVIDFTVIRDVCSLLWVINLGCIDLNPWYARCDDVDRPDYLHFDLDPVKGASWDQMLETASIVHHALDQLKLPSFIKTTGSRGFHVYVPIIRGPTQKEVWMVAKQFATTLASLYPDLITAEYRIAKRPRSACWWTTIKTPGVERLPPSIPLRPQPKATVSTPITWKELQKGVRIEDFRIDNVRERIKKVGDLWAPLLADTGRANLDSANGTAR